MLSSSVVLLTSLCSLYVLLMSSRSPPTVLLLSFAVLLLSSRLPTFSSCPPQSSCCPAASCCPPAVLPLFYGCPPVVLKRSPLTVQLLSSCRSKDRQGTDGTYRILGSGTIAGLHLQGYLPLRLSHQQRRGFSNNFHPPFYIIYCICLN